MRNCVNLSIGIFEYIYTIARLKPAVKSTTIPKYRGWVDAADLRLGERVRKADGSYGTVKSIILVRHPQTMYNLTVEKDHTFFVGDGRWLVHNTDICGPFRLTDRGWEGYPDDGLAPKPNADLRLLGDDEYQQALAEKTRANAALHRAHPEWRGLDIHEIHPVKFGGSPTDIANKIVLTRAEHVPYTTFWNQLQTLLENSLQ